MYGIGPYRLRVLTRNGDERPSITDAGVLVGVPTPWAPAIQSLVTISAEYPDVGLLVTNVGPGRPAAVAGVERGDVLLRYGGVELNTAETLNRLIDGRVSAEADEPVVLEAIRGAREMVFTVSPDRLGITVSPMLYRLHSHAHPSTGRTAAETAVHGGELKLIKVPGEVASQVLVLTRRLADWSAPAARKRAKALLAAASQAG